MILLVIVGVLGSLIPAVGFGDPSPTPTPSPSPLRRLSEFARGRNLQRPSTNEKSGIVITDDNLKSLGSGVELTAVTGQSSKPSDPVPNPEKDDPRALWRERVKEQLKEIRTLEADAKVLEEEIGGLWELFYACDEPDEREGKIRPRLMNRIEDRTGLRGDLKTARSDFENLLAEARRNGALPGWFRDLLN